MTEFDATKSDQLAIDDEAFPATQQKQKRGGGKTLLDSLREELGKKVKSEPITLSVPMRPGMSLKFDTNIEAGQIQVWRKACQNKSMVDNFDSLKFSCIVIANKTDEVLFKGAIVTSDDGETLNFKNPAFLEMLDAPKAIEAVRTLYGVDGHIFVAADEILKAAGYDGESQEDVDPTLSS